MSNGFSTISGQRVHDGLARLSDGALYGAILGTAMLIVAYLYEVVARYFFAAPTTWTNEVVAYGLCISVFLAMPKVTQQGGHVAVDLLLQAVGGRKRLLLQRSLLLVSALTCLVIAVVCGVVGFRQFFSGTLTMGIHPFPKWTITAFIAFGFALSGLHFLVQAVVPAAAAGDGDPAPAAEG